MNTMFFYPFSDKNLQLLLSTYDGSMELLPCNSDISESVGFFHRYNSCGPVDKSWSSNMGSIDTFVTNTVPLYGLYLRGYWPMSKRRFHELVKVLYIVIGNIDEFI